jgi:hypothetical protein
MLISLDRYDFCVLEQEKATSAARPSKKHAAKTACESFIGSARFLAFMIALLTSASVSIHDASRVNSDDADYSIFSFLYGRSYYQDKKFSSVQDEFSDTVRGLGRATGSV